jgi:hypothetical protein
MGGQPALSDRRKVLERRIRSRRIGEALAGYTLRFAAGSTAGITWDQAIADELARVPPEAALRVMHGEWSPAGWAVSCIFKPGYVLVWQARHKPTMELGDFLTAIDPLDLHEQLKLYPARRVTMGL